ncbi:hypothetical protein [Paraburkholderia piptadeniae]|uniref:hypothetical protein n=1 Tax=Paraburkholderia piptadeniae TaxID=1701573 RepID=UPI00135ABF83|nr:hypothetical protein [Paraburkholderia piptadeniae]
MNSRINRARLIFGHHPAASNRHQFFAPSFALIHFVHAPSDQRNFIGSMDKEPLGP